MGTSWSKNSFPPLTKPSNDGASEQLDSLTDAELFSFMSSRRSEFIRIAAILKAREESAKAEALKDPSATIAELQDKNGCLEKELLSLRNNEAGIEKMMQETSNQRHNRLNREIIKFEKKKKDCARFESELANRKKDCTALRESEKLAQDNINDLMEEVRREWEESGNRRAEDELNALKYKYIEIEKKETNLTADLIVYRIYCSRIKGKFTSLQSEYSALRESEEKTKKRCKLLEEVQLKLEKARNERIVEFDSWKDKYSPTETWIQQFLEKNPHLVNKEREQATKGDKQNAKFDSSNKNCCKRKFSDGSNISKSFAAL